MSAKSLVERVYNTLSDWGEPIATSELLDYLGMSSSRKSRQRVSSAITQLKKRHGVNIESSRAVKGKGGVSYKIAGTPPTTIRFNRMKKTNKTKEFVSNIGEKDVAKDRKQCDADQIIDSKPEDDQYHLLERMAESPKQREVAEGHVEKKIITEKSAALSPQLTKDLRSYEVLCYHYIRSRKGLTSSVQVADYYELSQEEGACLLNRVSKRFSDVSLTIYAKV